MIESGAQLFTRLKRNTHICGLNQKLFSADSPVQNQIIEITGETSSGKTILLLDCLARCILPKNCSFLNTSGKESQCIFINTEHKCSVLKIVEIINYYLFKANKQYSHSQIESIIESSLKRLTVFNCYDNNQFKMSLLHVDYVVNANPDISLIAIDGISNFYWCNRIEKSTRLSLNSYNNKILSYIQRLVDDCGLVAIFTKATNNVEKEVTQCDLDYKIILLKGKQLKSRGVVLKKEEESKNVFYKLGKTIEWLNE